MSSDAERQELFTKAAQARDAILAYRDMKEVYGLVRELVQIRGQDEDLNGGCAIACLTLIFGPEVVSMSEPERLGDIESHFDFIMEKLKPLYLEEGWDLIFPSSANEFIEAMENDAKGALVYVPNHVIGVIPAWKKNPSDERTFDRIHLVLDTESPELVHEIDDGGLAELFAKALIDYRGLEDHEMIGQRVIFIFTR